MSIHVSKVAPQSGSTAQVTHGKTGAIVVNCSGDELGAMLNEGAAELKTTMTAATLKKSNRDDNK